MALHSLLWVHVIVVLAHYSQRAQWVDCCLYPKKNEDDLSVDNNDTEPDTDQELTINKTDDDDITADGDDISITADGDNTSITTDGDDTQQDETDPITDTNNENTHKDAQMETAVLETDEDQGAPQI